MLLKHSFLYPIRSLSPRQERAPHAGYLAVQNDAHAGAVVKVQYVAPQVEERRRVENF